MFEYQGKIKEFSFKLFCEVVEKYSKNFGKGSLNNSFDSLGIALFLRVSFFDPSNYNITEEGKLFLLIFYVLINA